MMMDHLEKIDHVLSSSNICMKFSSSKNHKICGTKVCTEHKVIISPQVFSYQQAVYMGQKKPRFVLF